VTHQKNQPHPSLEKNELPPKKIKIKIKNCPGTRAQGCGALVPGFPSKNVIAQISAKVAIASRFLGFVGSLSSSEQQLWFPNQNVKDPDTWTLSP
jgi:hypothetical protein